MEDFKIRKHIRCGDEGVNDYIEGLENFILNLKASNTNRLIFKLDELNGVFADDLQMIIDGDDFSEIEVPILGEEDGFDTVKMSKLKVLTGDKDNRVFERIISLYGKLKDLKETANIVKGMIPEVEEPKIEAKKSIAIDASKPIVEQLQERHWKKNKGGV